MSAKARLGLFFKRGLRALLPTVLTIGVLVIVVNFFADKIVSPVNGGMKSFLTRTAPGKSLLDGVFGIDVHDEKYVTTLEEDPEKWEAREIHWERVREDLDDSYPDIVGFFVALLLVFVAGFLLATFVGRRVLGRFEGAMARFPVVKVIYPYARQVVEFFMREKTVKFNSVVALEYPRRGLWSLGFVTGIGMKSLNESTGETLVNIFIPTSPTPVTGYVLFVPVDELIPLPITVDQAIRFAISGGVLIPEGQQNPEEILERFRLIEPPSIGERPAGSEEGPAEDES